MSDYIRREDAIKAVGKHLDRLNDTPEGVMEGTAKAWLKDVPPAEPEIIHCGDCYWWEKYEKSLQGRCERYGCISPTSAWFCANARRK